MKLGATDGIARSARHPTRTRARQLCCRIHVVPVYPSGVRTPGCPHCEPRDAVGSPPRRFHRTPSPSGQGRRAEPRAVRRCAQAHVRRMRGDTWPPNGQHARPYPSCTPTREGAVAAGAEAAVPCLANAVAAALPCRHRAGPAAPNQHRPALSSSSSSPSAPSQPRRTVVRPPDGAVTGQAPPRRTLEAGQAAGHRRHRFQPFPGQKPPLSTSAAVRDNSSGQVRPSPAGDSAAGEEQAAQGLHCKRQETFRVRFGNQGCLCDSEI
jgi:hypothetical protein